MLRLLITITILFHLQLCFAQVSDFISVRKKSGRIIKSFIPGSRILFETSYGGFIEGPIKEIKRDSIFITAYDTRTLITNFGARYLDTVRTYVVPFHYKEIKAVNVFHRRGFFSRIDKLLVLGGTGYFALNLLNGAYLNESVTSEDNLKSLGISAMAVGTGLLLKHVAHLDNFSRRKHRIVYVHM
jgi:hypothetical protein